MLELDSISAPGQNSLEVMTLRWTVLSQEKRWEDCRALAEHAIAVAPGDAFGWIHRSYALHELKRTREARDLLLPAAKQFPDDETLLYNLACYECRLGQLDVARDWLRKVKRLFDGSKFRAQALEDPDLQPLWAEIQQWPLHRSARRSAG